jgi:hypothetical protein
MSILYIHNHLFSLIIIDISLIKYGIATAALFKGAAQFSGQPKTLYLATARHRKVVQLPLRPAQLDDI